MPIYEYKCSKCNGSFSLLQKIGSSERDTECPLCGAGNVKKIVSAFAYSSSDGRGGFSSSSQSVGFGGG